MELTSDDKQLRCLNISTSTINLSRNATDPIVRPKAPIEFLPNDRILSEAQRSLAEKLAGMIQHVETRNKIIRQQLTLHQNPFDSSKFHLSR